MVSHASVYPFQSAVLHWENLNNTKISNIIRAAQHSIVGKNVLHCMVNQMVGVTVKMLLDCELRVILAYDRIDKGSQVCEHVSSTLLKDRDAIDFLS